MNLYGKRFFAVAVLMVSAGLTSTYLLAKQSEAERAQLAKNTEVWEDKTDSVSLFIGDHCKVRVT